MLSYIAMITMSYYIIPMKNPPPAMRPFVTILLPLANFLAPNFIIVAIFAYTIL